METYTNVLLVTANVGSLFENVSRAVRVKLKLHHTAMLPVDYTECCQADREIIRRKAEGGKFYLEWAPLLAYIFGNLA